MTRNKAHRTAQAYSRKKSTVALVVESADESGTFYAITEGEYLRDECEGQFYREAEAAYIEGELEEGLA